VIGGESPVKGGEAPTAGLSNSKKGKPIKRRGVYKNGGGAGEHYVRPSFGSMINFSKESEERERYKETQKG